MVLGFVIDKYRYLTALDRENKFIVGLLNIDLLIRFPRGSDVKKAQFDEFTQRSKAPFIDNCLLAIKGADK